MGHCPSFRVASIRSFEVFITSTAGGIMPVRSVDKKLIGDGLPGPVTMRIRDKYWKLHEDPDYSTPVRYDAAIAA